MSCSVCLSVCLFDCLSDYLPDRPSACLSICLPPAAAFHPYCPQWFGNNFRRKYTQSRVICQSVVMKVARHVCKSGLSVPVVLLIELHVCKSGHFAPVNFHVCCPELRQEPTLLRVLRKRNSSGKASSDAGPELAGRESCVAMESPQALMCPLEKGVRGIEISGLCCCPAMNWSARN